MKHLSTDNYTVAWFKLAECVSRGEKERAFGVYRLLSHSFDDRALAFQLEGDLFLAFSMTSEALERYEKAAQRYKQSGRLLESACVYEHMCTLHTTEASYKKALLTLYSNLQFQARVAELALELAVIYIKSERLDSVRNLSSQVSNLDSFAAQAHCYERLMYTIYELLGNRGHLSSFFVEHAVKVLLLHGDDALLQRFMNTLKATDDVLYQVATKEIQD